MNSNIFLGSDYHIYHYNIIKLNNRPFNDLVQMRSDCLKSINQALTSSSTLYYLGDFHCSTAEQVRDFVKCICTDRIYVLLGNHDDATIQAQKKYNLFKGVYDLYKLRWNKKRFILCHYPLLSFEGMWKGSYHFTGHSHLSQDSKRDYGTRRLDVGYDHTKKWIISLEEAIELAEHNYASGTPGIANINEDD